MVATDGKRSIKDMHRRPPRRPQPPGLANYAPPAANRTETAAALAHHLFHKIGGIELGKPISGFEFGFGEGGPSVDDPSHHHGRHISWAMREAKILNERARRNLRRKRLLVQNLINPGHIKLIISQLSDEPRPVAGKTFQFHMQRDRHAVHIRKGLRMRCGRDPRSPGAPGGRRPIENILIPTSKHPPSLTLWRDKPENNQNSIINNQGIINFQYSSG